MAARSARIPVWDRDLSPYEPTACRRCTRNRKMSPTTPGLTDHCADQGIFPHGLGPRHRHRYEFGLLPKPPRGTAYARAKYGRIINRASIASKKGGPNISTYSVTKAGVIGFAKGLAKELSDNNVMVNCIASAMTETELLNGMTAEHIRACRQTSPWADRSNPAKWTSLPPGSPAPPVVSPSASSSISPVAAQRIAIRSGRFPQPHVKI